MVELTEEEKRGEYTCKRKKKFSYLKNTGQLLNYYRQKREPIKKVAVVETKIDKIMEEEKQIKHSFDPVTLKKIGKGALIAGTGAAALYILGAFGAIDFGSVITPIVAALVPILVNIVREWMKGV